MIQLTAKVRFERGSPSRIVIDVPASLEDAMDVFVAKLRGGPAILQLKKWYQGRTTGWGSQSHHLWGHAEQIGNHLGYAKSEMMQIIADMTPSWPRREYEGKSVSVSESGIDSFTASEAIDVAHRIAAEENITLIEEAF